MGGERQYCTRVDSKDPRDLLRRPVQLRTIVFPLIH
jgi:hypothetical protein